MPFGILEDRHMEHVPGTAVMHDQTDMPEELKGVPSERLKHGSGRFAHIVLIPQPTDDPNDPLNWPTWRKDFILFIVGLSAAVVGAYGPMLGPGFVPIAAELGITINTISEATAWLLLTLGAIVFLINPLAKKFGKRPVYIFAICILFAANVWGALVKDYPSFLASRIVGAIGMAPYEVLVQATISDIYFVHQRATRIAVWNLFLMCGIAGASFISGYIIEDLGYQWTFGVCAIFFGIFMFAIFFFVPETSYRRPDAATVIAQNQANAAREKLGSEGANAGVEKSETYQVETAAVEPPPKTSYWRSLRIFTGSYTNAPLLRIMTRPFVMFLYPAVLWAFLIYGTTITWIVVFSVVNGVLFVAPPYNFTVGEAGLTGLSPFVLTIIAEVVSGPLNDWICVKLTERNRGVYEPEFRLVLMVVVVILGVVGFYGFGATVDAQTHWSGPVLTYGIANMALGFSGPSVFGYVIDSYPNLAEESFVAINARNFLTFGLTYFVNDWLAKQGALEVFSILGSCFLGVCLLTIPLWIFGKRIRSFIARREFLNNYMSDLD
ncbi:serine/threonine kinase 16 [Lineolata rhizophorae]|uniref:Serine/threonine kinase 16 n=1 Tax=Lineolata rhizophorae TaxID=578093 RepID=A0A6A6NQ93_9PEZI|nr:serine/threonine kinase 16 [Lineolata rhizophorae]